MGMDPYLLLLVSDSTTNKREYQDFCPENTTGNLAVLRRSFRCQCWGFPFYTGLTVAKQGSPKLVGSEAHVCCISERHFNHNLQHRHFPVLQLDNHRADDSFYNSMATSSKYPRQRHALFRGFRARLRGL